MQESLVPQLHLQTKHKIYAIKSKQPQKIGLIYITERKLLTRLHSHDL